MALKFDMSSPQWARMASYQQQQKMASTLGEDIGTAIGLGAAGIADKAKKRWGKDWKKAVDEGKTKTGDWKEYKQEVRNRERQDKTISKMQKDEQFSGQMDKEWEQYSNFAKHYQCQQLKHNLNLLPKLKLTEIVSELIVVAST